MRSAWGRSVGRMPHKPCQTLGILAGELAYIVMHMVTNEQGAASAAPDGTTPGREHTMNTHGRSSARLIGGSVLLAFALLACGDTATTPGAGPGAPSASVTPCPPAGFGDTVGGTAGHTSTGQDGTTAKRGTDGSSDPADTSGSTTAADGTPDTGDTTAENGDADGTGGTTGDDGAPDADPCTRPGE